MEKALNFGSVTHGKIIEFSNKYRIDQHCGAEWDTDNTLI